MNHRVVVAVVVAIAPSAPAPAASTPPLSEHDAAPVVSGLDAAFRVGAHDDLVTALGLAVQDDGRPARS
jgi:hypothetical protein